MSPTPLIELQRGYAEVGRIRMGEKSDKGAPKRLDTWRLTSASEELIREAAALYGGEPRPWGGSTRGDEWEVITTSTELPVLIFLDYALRQQYELRTSPTLVERRCDGTEMDDGTPCLCNAEEDDKCDLITRLRVSLPELRTALGWRLETKGVSAAHELLGSMDIIRGLAGAATVARARLRIQQRRGNVDGQAVRYVVPVLDVSVRYAEILGGESSRELAALPAGYTPIEPRASNGVTLAEGLREAETQQLRKPPRVALPEDDDILDDLGSPVGSSTPPGGSPLPEATPDTLAGGDAAPAAEPPAKPLTLAQAKKKMDAMVGQLREERHITTMQLWSAVATERKVSVETMISLLHGHDDGELRWSPLRDDLQLEEARALHGRLARLYASTREGAVA